ncbi:MAG: ATP-binding cassette domain-containing protein [Rhodocyclaceae bacterium]|nr:ATP-binding cassette domain-containing protein [Rhodocyclaceae bacterium]
MTSNSPDTRAMTLSLRGFGIAFGERVVLASIDLDVPERGVTVLMGPAGTGKSTLLRTLAGSNGANPSLRTWGRADYLGEPWGARDAPAMVAQSARLLMSSVLENVITHLPERAALTRPEQRALVQRLLQRAGLADLVERLDAQVSELPLWQQRQLAILRLCAAGPRLLMVDEPTAGLEPDQAACILDFLAAEGERRALLVVLHNQQEAHRLGGSTVLIAGGRVMEAQGTDSFFAHPRSDAGRDFVRSGSCAVPAPDAVSDDLDEGVLPPPPLPPEARDYVPDSFGPRGFLWLLKGRLAGTPMPGVVHDLGYDLRLLRRVGVDTLLTLTETPLDAAMLRKYGIAARWFPIPDMHAPDSTQALQICTTLDELIGAERVVAVHCLAGLGRTGTILACYLIWEGNNALGALEAIRNIEPRWVQSELQLKFLQSFADDLRTGRIARPAPAPDRARNDRRQATPGVEASPKQ